LAFPGPSTVNWWVVCDAGKGGLGDPSSPDYRVARDAMAADGHIEFGDYVLLYATKKDTRMVPDRRTGEPKRILKDTSTWTWKIRRPVLRELEAEIETHCARLAYGSEGIGEQRAWGIRG